MDFKLQDRIRELMVGGHNVSESRDKDNTGTVNLMRQSPRQSTVLLACNLLVYYLPFSLHQLGFIVSFDIFLYHFPLSLFLFLNAE